MADSASGTRNVNIYEKDTGDLHILRMACKQDYDPGRQIMNPYKVKEPKSEEEIESDAKELRQGASVKREDADRLAREYESYYLRRNIAQLKKDAAHRGVSGDFGAILVRRVESGHEPEDYPRLV